MAETSHIEWTDATWNPVTGCSVVSPGCTNCYAMKLAGTRLQHHPSRVGLTRETKAGPVWTGEVRLNEEWLDQPLRWRRGRRIFVCAHGDLFHESVPDEWIDRVFAVMALCPQHVFQVLTKRADRMRAYLSGRSSAEHLSAWSQANPCGSLPITQQAVEAWLHPDATDGHRRLFDARLPAFPLPNVWLGVSVEDQPRADERIPDLLATPAAVRFLSCEPLLGPVDLTEIDDGSAHREVPLEEWGPLDDDDSPPALWWDALTGQRTIMHGGASGDWSRTDASLDWVICGGESGPRARPMHPDWARRLRDQCAAAGVPYFFKQWGAWVPLRDYAGSGYWATNAGGCIRLTKEGERADAGYPMQLVGKKASGRLLDGVTHDAMPQVPA